jgi:hypothetical protein
MATVGDGAAHTLLKVLELYAVISLKIDLLLRLKVGLIQSEWINVGRNGYVES